jgi:hypothetical protein
MNVAYKQPMGGAHKPYKLTGKVPGLNNKKPVKKKK